jgi:hypothetical protein
MSDVDTGIEEAPGTLRHAAETHGKREQQIGRADPDRLDWHALCMARGCAGEELPA